MASPAQPRAHRSGVLRGKGRAGGLEGPPRAGSAAPAPLSQPHSLQSPCWKHRVCGPECGHSQPPPLRQDLPGRACPHTGRGSGWSPSPPSGLDALPASSSQASGSTCRVQLGRRLLRRGGLPEDTVARPAVPSVPRPLREPQPRTLGAGPQDSGHTPARAPCGHTSSLAPTPEGWGRGERRPPPWLLLDPTWSPKAC